MQGRGSAQRNAARRGASTEQGATRNVKLTAPTKRDFGWFNRLLVLLAAGLVLVAATQAAIVVQAIPVEQINVTGALAHTRSEVVQELIQPALLGGFLRADLQRIRRQLLTLPWIYEASVRRRWPSTLDVHVVEQRAIARWGEGGFLNHKGHLFHPASGSDWNSLPRLQGPSGSPPLLMANYQRLVKLLAPAELAVEQLHMDARGQMRATLSGNLQLILGGEQMLERVQRFVGVYRSLLVHRSEKIERVDLRYESGMAVVFGEPPAVAGI